MLSEENNQVFMSNATVPAGRPERLQEILFNPIDDGSWIHVQQTAQVVRRVDTLDRGLFHVA
jgi:hypothetical protein